MNIIKRWLIIRKLERFRKSLRWLESEHSLEQATIDDFNDTVSQFGIKPYFRQNDATREELNNDYSSGKIHRTIFMRLI